KVPGSPWLLTRKALIQAHLNQVDAAKLSLRTLVQTHPDNVGGSILLTRLVLETDGPIQAVAQLQQTLSSCRSKGPRPLGWLASLVGSALSTAGYHAAALAHLGLASRLGDDEGRRNASALQSLKANPAISTWEKNPYRLWPAPEQASQAFRE